MPNPQIENGHLDLNGGWVRLYRKTLESAVFQNPVMLKIWIWCLLKANHEGRSVFVRTGRGETLVNLQPGQFIFGRNSASKELSLPASTIRNKITQLEKMGNLSIHVDRHYSIVFISRWKEYQPDNWTGKGQAKDRQTQNLGQATGQAISDEKTENQDKQLDRQKNEHRQKVDTNNNTRIYIAKAICSNDESFVRFWQAYPRKIGKKTAKQKFDSILKKTKDQDALLETIFSAIDIQKHSEQWQKDGGQFIPHPTTWLNQERWNDEIELNLKAQENAEILKNWGKK